MQASWDTFKDYSSQAQQGLYITMNQIKNTYNNLDTFQKVCQIAIASFQLLINVSYLEGAKFSRLISILMAANLHVDFYSFLRHPNWFHSPVSHSLINDIQVRDALKDHLSKVIPNTTEENAERNKDIAEATIKSLLLFMMKNNLSYRNVEDFKKALADQLDTTIREFEEDGKLQKISKKRGMDDTYDGVLKLSALQINLLHTPLFQRLSNCSWLLTDYACMGIYFKEWGLLDTAKWAGLLGQYRAFEWMKSSKAETYFMGIIATSYGLKFIENARKYCDDALTPQERTQAKWNIITSLAECILYTAICSNSAARTAIPLTSIYLYTKGVKALGILAWGVQDKQKQFFQVPVRN